MAVSTEGTPQATVLEAHNEMRYLFAQVAVEGWMAPAAGSVPPSVTVDRTADGRFIAYATVTREAG